MAMAQALNTYDAQFNHRLVDELREERHQVWSLYCKVAEQKPFRRKSQTLNLLNQFSQILIDYISLGHFGIYEHLLSEQSKAYLVATAEQIYPEFSAITEAAVQFNDKYDENNPDLSMESLESDLSQLGEKLAQRIDLEDMLCKLVLQ